LALLTGRGSAPGLSLLRERGRDVRIARVCGPDGGSVIVKLWNRPGWRGMVRRWSHTGSGYREYSALCLLAPQEIGTPRPLAYLHLRDPLTPYTDALVSSDLGVCSDCTEYYKRLLQAAPPSEVFAFEEQIIASTAGLLRAHLVDPDHRLPNFVMTPENRPVRLDFELCRHLWLPACHPRLVGLMIGTLLGSYAFAVQPDRRRLELFVARLRAAVQPSAAVRRVAAQRVAAMMERQLRETGIDMRVPDVWVQGDK
jgi:hypothetical protein